MSLRRHCAYREAIIPEIVKDVPVPGEPIIEDKVDRVGDDEHGWVDIPHKVTVGENPPTMRKAMNYDGLIPILVKAIQEQQAQIEALEARIEALENR